VSEHLVIVDDEEDLLRSLAAALRRARPTAAVHAFVDSTEAAAHLDRGAPISALITDIRMPRLDGVDLLVRARARDPLVPAVIMTAFSSATLASQIATFGTVEYLEKPFSVSTFTSAVGRVLHSQNLGFSGALALDGLPDLIQLCALSTATSALRVRRDDRSGTIWFDRGNVVHAEEGVREGADAFYEIVRWTGGEFSVERGAVTRKRTVMNKPTELLMEALRRQDEDIVGASIAAEGSVDELFDFDVDLAIREFDAPWEGPAPSQATEEAPSQPRTPEKNAMANIQLNLEKLRGIDGYVGSCLVDSESGMTLGLDGGGAALNLEVAAAGNTEVIRAKRKAMKALNLRDEIEDILITLGRQYHIMRPLRARPAVFYYVALDRQRANLAMARMALADTEKALEL
jgi:DNA-binding response OmpR family regulator